MSFLSGPSKKMSQSRGVVRVVFGRFKYKKKINEQKKKSLKLKKTNFYLGTYSI